MQNFELRKIILKLHNQGDSQKKIADAVGMTQGRISQILKEEKANKSIGDWGGHKPCKLNDSQIKKLKDYLNSSAEDVGFVGQYWNAPRVKKLIQDTFGITYHVSSLYPLFRRLGYSPQKYTTVDYRQDEEEIEKFVEETLPALKKSGNRKQNHCIYGRIGF